MKKITPASWLSMLAIVSVISLLALQSLWLHNAYYLAYEQFVADAGKAFDEACRKEQVYRMPFGQLMAGGNLTIQSCGMEKIQIIRNCPSRDTIIYDNVYGQSMETVINRAMFELREKTLPMNIYCLADLFAGALHDKDLSLSFVIERFNPATGEVFETSLLPGVENPAALSTQMLTVNMSEIEGLRAKLQFNRLAVFHHMAGVLAGSLFLLVVLLSSIALLFRLARRRRMLLSSLPELPQPVAPPEPSNTVYHLGRYTFDADKNELENSGVVITLNKKEHAILLALCERCGNVVERNKLLEDNWGSTGFIYSRSLDTYITKIRKYLKDDPSVQIVTIKGVGYKLIF